jgi:hypothetical protein
LGCLFEKFSLLIILTIWSGEEEFVGHWPLITKNKGCPLPRTPLLVHSSADSFKRF